MRSRYIWTSCRHVSSFALKAARMSAIVASWVQISRNAPASAGITASSSKNNARPSRRTSSLYIFFPLHWSMTDRFDVVTVGIEHKSTIVVGMVVRANAWGAIVLAARCKRRTVERIDRLPIFRKDRDVHGLVQLAFGADPKVRFAAAAETGGRLPGLLSGHLHDQRVAKRRQRLFVKGLCARVVRHRKSHVIDHDVLRVIHQPRPEEPTEGRRLEGRPRARPCRLPSFETPC